MKTLFLTIVVLLSFSSIVAQDTFTTSNNKSKIENQNHTTKIDFYRALISKNNFDIKIKAGSNMSSRKTKADFYKELMEKNGFIPNKKKTTRLATLNNEIKEGSSKQSLGLLP
ncbi:hypothetical protein [Aquimarina sp. RZ0]|uniref:hypothetical protein n=1 Tax=Aquimarina sp. RZ0 TaxID=2607730 RepID=UPI0011F2B532|nr:hypothetical protein [Aquimarina sp. RZ0]KAA1246674.1 hypothetical protein F0000_06430 [Aquimarina sp. RZ0]